ncbi:MAG: zinc-ribbon domain-containing protein [Deltaproteobacteria bacterium]|nr:zinc-ribbon domain-containing protein [Deltaproteobacteria bacterium]MBW1833930.1 zinc-ribbon domain-containing protein [Deltaproteobacteria bacterium]MBW2165954.1 zinc-ribbon domain-containing protein [Deltaproteobacteria bacterium]
MEVICKQCQSKFKIPNEKIPKGRVFSLTCPKCNNKISIDTRPVASSSPEKTQAVTAKPKPGQEKTIFDEVVSGTYNASEKPFDFVEEGVETALLCETNPAILPKIKLSLKNMGYHTTEAQSALDALKQMRFHVFDVVVLNEKFDAHNPDENNVLKYLKQLSMDVRRNIFAVLITDRFRTMDNMAAFHKSVNMVVNLNNIEEIEKILKSGITDNTIFYQVFKESLAKIGKV